MSEGPSRRQPLVVEATETKPGFAGTSVPRKEDSRLVQGQGVFFDDVKRHGMGFVHFVRSPYAHAKIVSIDVSAALELGRRLRDAHRRRGGDPHRPVLRDVGAAGERDQGLRARGRQDALRRRARRRRRRRDARPRARRGRARRGRVRAARRRSSTRGSRTDDGAPILHDEAGSNVVWEGVFDWGDWEGAVAESDHVVRISELHFDRFSSTPLECSGCARRVQPRHRRSGRCTATTRCPGSARSGWRRRCAAGSTSCASSPRTSAARFGNKICLHPYFVACCLLARKLNRPVQWTEWRTDQHMANAHGNERWFQDVEVAVKADGTLLGFKLQGGRRLRRVPALRAARLHHLGAGHARLLPLAERPRRLHAGRARTSRRCRRTAATRGCSTSG